MSEMDIIAASGLFDEQYYVWRHGLSDLGGLSNLEHYMSHGADANLAPHPLFDPLYYREQTGVSGNPLAHYLQFGWREGLCPHPLFDVSFYFAQRPDLKRDGVEPLSHYLAHGANEDVNPHWYFDSAYYLLQNPRVSEARMNPLVHFVQHGAGQGRDPSREFHYSGYLAENPDVAAAGVNALEHYVRFGRREGRARVSTPRHEPSPAPASGRPAPARSADPSFAPISVVLPTYNRADLLKETLEICEARRGGVEVEFVIIDDGSSDHTAQVLTELEGKIPNLVWRTIPNGGPGQARNLGVSLASHEVVLFLGDDLQPLDDEFFRTHARLHATYPSNRFGVLGKCVWPETEKHKVSFVMAHIQGHGGEQFGYADLSPHTFIDYRFFYTANVSVKKSIIEDWIAEGFRSDFTFAAFEDAEIAYRLSKQPGGFTIYYDPTSLGRHIHPYNVEGFINRQISAGMMGRTFESLHPELSIVPAELTEALRSPKTDEKLVSDYMAVIDGIKAWAKLIDASGTLGREGWHDDLLFAVFELSYLQGYLLAEARADANLAAAYKFVISNCLRRVRRIVHHEIAAHRYVQDTLLALV
jgi:glycosyltransferase involved in cell wall biosynthesis